MSLRLAVLLAALLFLGTAEAQRVVDQSVGPVQENRACGRNLAEVCDLRIYQVMVESFVDGDSAHDYTDGYGTSHHRGDLRGIIQSLDYIRDLGMNAIWLTPVFDSDAGQPQRRIDGSTHVDLKLDATGYYARNFFAIDPKFGTLEDARELVDAAHERGLYVFFDGVFGHHKGDLAPSPQGRLPIDSTDPGDYFGNPSGYPGRVVDYDAPETLEFFKEVATYWIKEIGIDGWRLDVAYQVPLPAWREIKAAVEAAAQSRRLAGKQWGTLGYMVAEIFSGADDIVTQALGTEAEPALDSAFDFPLRWATVGVLAAEENGLSGRPASTLNESWAYGAHSYNYRPGAVLNMMLGNHDFVRFGDLLQRAGIAEPEDAAWWARHRLAFMVQAAYSGVITRYYGEELGDEVPNFAAPVAGDCASQGLCDDHVARSSAKVPGVSVMAESLSADQQALLQFHRELMTARSDYSALSRGSRQHLFSDNVLYIDLKTHGSQQVVFAMNSGSSPQTIRIATSLFLDAPEMAWDILGGSPVTVSGGYLEFELEALQGRYILLAGQAVGRAAINFGMADAWFDPTTNGQGFLISVFPQVGQVFLAWFTFDTERPADGTPAYLGEPGHRWLTAQGSLAGHRAQLRAYSTSGGVFDSPQPVPQPEAVGWMELEFHGCNEARLLYHLDQPALEGEVPLQRIVTDNVALCEVLGEDDS